MSGGLSEEEKERRKKTNQKILKFLYIPLGVLIIIAMIVDSQPDKEVQLPSLDHLQPEASLLLNSTWPQIITAMPGLKKYSSDLEIIEISETMLDFKKPIDEYNNHLTVVVKVSDEGKSIPANYLAWGHNCYIDIYPAEKKFITTKTACKSVLMDRTFEYDKTGEPLVLKLQ